MSQLKRIREIAIASVLLVIPFFVLNASLRDPSRQSWLDQQILVTYMACSDRGCRAPVENKSIAIRTPTKGMLQ